MTVSSGALFITPLTGPFNVSLLIEPIVSKLVINCVEPAAVGGITLDSDVRALPLEARDSGSSQWGIAIGMMTAGCLALGGAALYARKRRA